MEDEQYCLKWNNHQATLLTNLTCLMDTERLYDCLLSAEGKTIKSHQVVISACSPYLEGLLNDCRQPGLMPILVFSDLAYDELVALREYMYKGEVNIRQTALDSFLKAAHSLQIKGLADGGGGGEDQGGGGKRKAENDMNSRRRRRRESTESEDRHSTQSPVQAPVKKQNIFSNSSSNYENNQVKMEPVEQVSISHQAAPQIKAEQHEPPPETHDLTGADDDFDDDTGYDMAGTSQPDLSQDMSNWQMENSMNSEDFAAQAMAQQPGQSSQDIVMDVKVVDCLSYAKKEINSCDTSSDEIDCSFGSDKMEEILGQVPLYLNNLCARSRNSGAGSVQILDCFTLDSQSDPKSNLKLNGPIESNNVEFSENLRTTVGSTNRPESSDESVLATSVSRNVENDGESRVALVNMKSDDEFDRISLDEDINGSSLQRYDESHLSNLPSDLSSAARSEEKDDSGTSVSPAKKCLKLSSILHSGKNPFVSLTKLNETSSNSLVASKSNCSSDVNRHNGFVNGMSSGGSSEQTLETSSEMNESSGLVVRKQRKSKILSGLASISTQDINAYVEYLDSPQGQSYEPDSKVILRALPYNGNGVSNVWCAWCLTRVTNFNLHLSSVHGERPEVNSASSFCKNSLVDRIKVHHIFTVAGNWVMTYSDRVYPCYVCFAMVDEADLDLHLTHHPPYRNSYYNRFVFKCRQLKESLDNQFIFKLDQYGVSGFLAEVSSNLIQLDEFIMDFGQFVSQSDSIDTAAYGKMMECAVTLFACSQINRDITDLLSLLSFDNVLLFRRVIKSFERMQLNSKSISITIHEFSRFAQTRVRVETKNVIDFWQKACDIHFEKDQVYKYPDFWSIDRSSEIYSKFVDFIKADIKLLTRKLEEQFKKRDWEILGDALLSRLLLLNQKFCVSGITKKNYYGRQNIDEALRESVELDILKECGVKGIQSVKIWKNFFIYTPHELDLPINVYRRCRKQAGSYPDNPFLFPEGSDGHLSAFHAVKRCWSRLNTFARLYSDLNGAVE